VCELPWQANVHKCSEITLVLIISTCCLFIFSFICYMYKIWCLSYSNMIITLTVVLCVIILCNVNDKFKCTYTFECNLIKVSFGY